MKRILALTFTCLILAVVLTHLSIQLGSVLLFICGILSIKASLLILILMAFEKK